MTARWWGSGDERPTQEQYVRIAAYAVCVDGGRVLLTRIAAEYPDAGWWTLPGGGLDFGEPPETGALRELEEETGLVGEIVSLLAVDSEAYPSRRWPGAWLQSLRILYRVRIAGGSARNERDGSTDLAAWIPLDEVDDLPLVTLAALGVRMARDEVAA